MNDSDSRIDVNKPKRPRPATDKRAHAEETKHLVTEAADYQDIKKVVVQDMTRKNGSEKRAITLVNERFAGNGAFGVVYQAKIAETGETVAVKKVFQDKRYKNREFQILKILNHPNVIRMRYAFISSGEKEDEIYLNVLMDYMPENLYELLQTFIKKKQSFPNMLIKLYSYQLLRSLAYIHGLGICHRDIKPQNILVDNSSLTLKMCDFGSAKQLVEGEPNIAYICSRYYRAPELICGNAGYTPSVDMWSVGCVIAELLLETPIFPGDSNSDQFIEIIKILGTPSQDQIRMMNPNMKDFNFPYIKPFGWRKVFRAEADPLLVDLISKILTYSPKRRLNPLEALLHPYFDELRGRNLQIGGKPVPDLFNFTTEELSIQPDLIHKLVPDWYSSR